jgi:hypothetical protein
MATFPSNLLYLKFTESLLLGGNVQLLDIWTGYDSGPYMHALHFVWAIGALLAPLIGNLKVSFMFLVQNFKYLDLIFVADFFFFFQPCPS